MSAIRDADATSAGITVVDPQSTAGCLKARCEIKPKISPPGFRRPKPIGTGRKWRCVAGAPQPIGTLLPGNATGCRPAGQALITPMQLHAPDAVAIGKNNAWLRRVVRRSSPACSRSAVGPAWPGSSAAGTAADEVRRAKTSRNPERRAGHPIPIAAKNAPTLAASTNGRVHLTRLFSMSSSEPLQQASALAQAIEALADQLTPEVIRAGAGGCRWTARSRSHRICPRHHWQGVDPHGLQHRRGERH